NAAVEGHLSGRTAIKYLFEKTEFVGKHRKHIGPGNLHILVERRIEVIIDQDQCDDILVIELAQHGFDFLFDNVDVPSRRDDVHEVDGRFEFLDVSDQDCHFLLKVAQIGGVDNISKSFKLRLLRNGQHRNMTYLDDGIRVTAEHRACQSGGAASTHND